MQAILQNTSAWINLSNITACKEKGRNLMNTLITIAIILLVLSIVIPSALWLLGFEESTYTAVAQSLGTLLGVTLRIILFTIAAEYLLSLL